VAQQWKPGQSGNPEGKGGSDYQYMMKILRVHTPEAARTMVALLNSDDDRVRLMASKEIIDRTCGKPRDMRPTYAILSSRSGGVSSWRE